MQTVRIIIHGMVQGVFFRKHTVEAANRIGISGFVMNASDGTVVAEATGDEESLEAFISWCHNGSPEARVTKVESRAIPTTIYSGFTIRYR